MKKSAISQFVDETISQFNCQIAKLPKYLLLLIVIAGIAGQSFGQTKDEQKSAQYATMRNVKKDSLNEVIKKCSKLIDLNPKDDKAYYMRADAKVNLTTYIDIVEPDKFKRANKAILVRQDAINDYLEVTKLNSKYTDTAYFKAGLYTKATSNGRYNKNIMDTGTYYMERAVVVNSKYVMAWENLANTYRISYKDYKRAIECYTKQIECYKKEFELNPLLNTVTVAYWHRGQCKTELKDYKGAIEDFTKAIEAKTKESQELSLYKIYQDRGLAKDGLKDYKGAIEDFTKALDVLGPNPNYPDYSNYYYRGIFKLKAGDKEGACLDWDKAKNLGKLHNVKINVADTISKYCK